MKVSHAVDDGGALEPLRVVFTTKDTADNVDSVSVIAARRADITSVIDVDDGDILPAFDEHTSIVTIYDQLGRVVVMSTTGKLPDLQRGVYVVIVMSDRGNVYSRRVLVK